MVINRGEDKPLLVSMLDGTCGHKGSDEEAYVDAKWNRPVSIKQKWKAGRMRGRAKNMVMGAASVINKWPEHLTLCWLFGMASCMLIIACILMLIGASRRLNTHPTTALGLQRQCISNYMNNPPKLPEKTIIHLHIIINEGESFNPYKYKNALKDTLKKHPNHGINIYVLLNDTSDQIFKRNSRFKNWEASQQGLDHYKFFDTSSAESGNTVTPLPLITGIGVNEQRVYVVRSTFSNYFKHSPLRLSWKTITPHALPIVFRVLTLWEHGGIAMPWQMFLDKTDNHSPDKSTNSQLKELLKELRQNNTDNNFKLDKHLLPHQLLDDLHEVINLGGLTIETGLYVSAESPLVVGDHGNSTQQIQRPQTKSSYEESSESSSGDSSSSYYSDSSSYYSDMTYSDHLPKSIESQEPTRLVLRPVETDDFVANEIDRFIKKGSKKKIAVEEKLIKPNIIKEREEVQFEQPEERPEFQFKTPEKPEFQLENPKKQAEFQFENPEEQKEFQFENHEEKEFQFENLKEQPEFQFKASKEQLEDQFKTPEEQSELQLSFENKSDFQFEYSEEQRELQFEKLEGQQKNESQNLKEKSRTEPKKVKEQSRIEFKKIKEQSNIELKNLKEQQKIQLKKPKEPLNIENRKPKEQLKIELNEPKDKLRNDPSKLKEQANIQHKKLKQLEIEPKKPKKQLKTEPNIPKDQLKIQPHKLKKPKIDPIKPKDQVRVEPPKLKDPRMVKDQNKQRVKRSLYPTSEEPKPYVVNLLPIESKEDYKDKIPSHVSGEHLEYQVKEIRDPFKELSEGQNFYKEEVLSINEAVGRKLNVPLEEMKLAFADIYLVNGKASSSKYESSSYSESSSDSSGSLETFKDIFGPRSDVIKKPKIKKFHEDKSHRLYEPFNHMNVFAIPSKMSVTLDQFGYYFAVKKPCHAYLGHLIALLQSLGNLEKFQEIIPESLRTFCGKQKLSNCNGISLI